MKIKWDSSIKRAIQFIQYTVVLKLCKLGDHFFAFVDNEFGNTGFEVGGPGLVATLVIGILHGEVAFVCIGGAGRQHKILACADPDKAQREG